MTLSDATLAALRGLHRRRKPFELAGLGAFSRVAGYWKLEPARGRPDPIVKEVQKVLRAERTCELPFGLLYLKEIRALGGGKARLDQRFEGYLAGAIPSRERTAHPEDRFTGALGFSFRRDWAVLDPLFATWTDRLSRALGAPEGVDPARAYRVLGHQRQSPEQLTDCLEMFTGGVNGAVKGVDWIDGLITAVALAEDDPAVRDELLEELRRAVGLARPSPVPPPPASSGSSAPPPPEPRVLDAYPVLEGPPGEGIPLSCLETAVLAAWIRLAGEAIDALLLAHDLAVGRAAAARLVRTRRFGPGSEDRTEEAFELAASHARHPSLGPRLEGFARALRQVSDDHRYHGRAHLSDGPEDEDEGMASWQRLEEEAYQDPQRGAAELAAAIVRLAPAGGEEALFEALQRAVRAA